MDKETFASLSIEDIQAYHAVIEKEREISSYREKYDSEARGTYYSGCVGALNVGLTGASLATTGGLSSLLFGGLAIIMGGVTYSGIKDLKKTSKKIGGLEKELDSLKQDPHYQKLDLE